MTDYKKILQETEASLLSAAGIALAGIFLIFSKEDIDGYLELALVLFSGSIPLLVGQAMLVSEMHLRDYDHDIWWKSLLNDDLHVISVIVPYMAIAFGIGLLINHISQVAMYAYSGCCLISFILAGTINRLGKLNKNQDGPENN